MNESLNKRNLSREHKQELRDTKMLILHKLEEARIERDETDE